MRQYLLFVGASISSVLCASTVHSAALVRDGADEQYAFIAGLAEKGMHERVVQEAQNFLAQYPKHAKADSARYRMACALFELKDREKAAVEFKRLFARHGFEFEAEVAFRLGQCELDLNDCAGAATAFQRAVDAKKDYLLAPAEWLLGEAELRCEHFDRAEASYRAVLALDPKGQYADDAVAGLAWCSFKSKKFDEAADRARRYVADFAKGERVDELRFLLGEALFESKHPKEALEAYGAVGHGAWTEGALRGAGFAYAELGDHERAARVFARAAAEYPDGRWAAECALHGGIEWLGAKKPKDALELLRSKQAGESVDVLSWRSRAEADLGDREAALADVDRALELAQDDDAKSRLRSSRADLLSALGKKDEAQREYERAGSDYALQSAAVAALSSGKTADARRSAQALIERFPNSNYRNDAWMVIGEAALAEKDFEHAAQSFQTALDGESDAAKRARAESRLAWCAYLGGDKRAAAEKFAALANQKGDAPEVDESAFMAARSLEALGDSTNAAARYDQYLSRFANGTRRDEAEFRRAKLDASEAGLAKLEQFVRAHPKSEFASKARYESAERLSAAARLPEAIARYREFLASDADSELAPAARYGLAWCLGQSGDSPGAVELLRPWLGEKNGEAELRASALELLLWNEAKLAPPDGVAAAWKAFVGATQDDERLLRAARVAGESLRKAGKTDDALALVDSLEKRGKNAKFKAELAIERVYLRLDQKKLDDAERELGRANNALKGDASVAEAAFFVGDARLESGDAKRALELFDLAAQSTDNPARDRALYKTGFAKLKADDPAGAESALGELVLNCPKSSLVDDALFLLGESQFRQRKFEEAEKNLERVRKEAPQSEAMPKVLFRLGVLKAEREDWKGSLELLAALAARKPDFENAAEVELTRGRDLAHLNRAREARAAFDKTISLDKGALSARAHLELGRLHLASKENDAALSEFLKVAVLYDLAEETAEALLLAGETLEAQGDQPRAIEQYREVVEKHAKSSSFAAAKARLAELGSKGTRGV